jgi:hypothetical protein
MRRKIVTLVTMIDSAEYEPHACSAAMRDRRTEVGRGHQGRQEGEFVDFLLLIFLRC